MKLAKTSTTRAAIIAGMAGSAVAVVTYLVIQKPEWRRPVLGFARNMLASLEGLMHWHDR